MGQTYYVMVRETECDRYGSGENDVNCGEETLTVQYTDMQSRPTF